MNLLEQIVERKRHEVALAKSQVPVSEWIDRADGIAPPRGFARALAADGLQLIAEVKKASPSAGVIRPDFDHIAISESYAAHGAACLSVLTDEVGFQGSLRYLTEARDAVALPVMRKDFILDAYQVIEARAAGADCILLIAECLETAELSDLFHQAAELGMDALIEVYDHSNLDRVLGLSPTLLGINNRDLRTFQTRLEHTLDLLDRIPEGVTIVSESGIRTRDDIGRLRAAGVDAVLIGETLMRHPDPGQAIQELFHGTPRMEP